MSDTAVRLSWQVPEYPNGGITKYIVELQQVGGTSEPQWIDTDNGAETTKIVGGLNASTTYQFRVRANSHVPGEWSQPVKAKTLGDGEWGVPRVSPQPLGRRCHLRSLCPLPRSLELSAGARCQCLGQQREAGLLVVTSGAATQAQTLVSVFRPPAPPPSECLCLGQRVARCARGRAELAQKGLMAVETQGGTRAGWRSRN